MGTLEDLSRLDPVQLTQATPMGLFWGATLSSASPTCGAVLEQGGKSIPVPCPLSACPQPTGDRREWRVL